MSNRRRNTRVIQCGAHRWVLRRRGTVWIADGRSGNERNFGRHSLGTSDEREARIRLVDLDQQLTNRPGTDCPSNVREVLRSCSIDDGIARYQQHLQRPAAVGGVLYSSRRRYKSVFAKFARFCRERQVASWPAVDRKVLDAYAALLERRRFTSGTIAFEITTIRQLIRHLHDEGILADVSRFSYRVVRPKGTTRAAWVEADIAKMLAICESDSGMSWLGIIIAALAWTGLRIGELTQLRWTDVNLDDRLIYVRHDHGRVPNRGAQTTKTKSSRHVPVCNALYCRLVALPHRDGLVFRGPEGSPLRPGRIRRVFDQRLRRPLAVRASDLDRERFERGTLHSFRHSFISSCIKKGIPESVVMRWVGHRTNATTQAYFHLGTEDSRSMVERLDRATIVDGNVASATAHNDKETPLSDDRSVG